MKTLRIVYHMRLGDVVRCLPIAKHFADDGWAVEIETAVEYHGVSALVSYARFVLPHATRINCDRVLDLQIWPRRAPEFEATGMTWQQYVYTLFPEGSKIEPTAIVFDKLPPAPDYINEEALCFPQGYSQRFRHHPAVILDVAHKLFPGVGVVAMGPDYRMEPTIFDYARRIQRARHVLTINSSASIFCSAVRASWHHVVSRHANEEWHDPRQIRVAIGDHA
jgi:hypothetical protein